MCVYEYKGFPGGKESAYNAGDTGSISGWGRSSGEGNSNPLQYSCLENSMTGEPGGLQFMVLQRVRHDWVTELTDSPLNTVLKMAIIIRNITWIEFFRFRTRDLFIYLFLNFILLLNFTNCISFAKYQILIKIILSINDLQFGSVQSLSHVRSLRPHESQHARTPCPSPTPGVYSDSCPSSQWCHAAISSSVIPFSSCPQSLPASRSFPMSQLFAWGGQSTGVSALASVLPKNTQDRSPLGWTGWNSLQSKGHSRVFSNTTVQKHQFFGAQLSL